MNQPFTPERLAQAQAQIERIQACYREWTQLLPRWQQADADWRRSVALLREMEAFYVAGGFGECRRLEEAGAPLQLHIDGEHSILGEDTLWNAHVEQHSLTWQRLRSTLTVLHRNGESAKPC